MKAGKKLLEQAIQRTELEMRHPTVIWPAQVRGNDQGNRITIGEIYDGAQRRLMILRTLQGMQR